jgi:hypothetical protein
MGRLPLQGLLPVTSCIVDSAAIYFMVAKFRNTICPLPPQYLLHRKAALSTNSKGEQSEYSRRPRKVVYYVRCLWLEITCKNFSNIYCTVITTKYARLRTTWKASINLQNIWSWFYEWMFLENQFHFFRPPWPHQFNLGKNKIITISKYTYCTTCFTTQYIGQNASPCDNIYYLH